MQGYVLIDSNRLLQFRTVSVADHCAPVGGVVLRARRKRSTQTFFGFTSGETRYDDFEANVVGVRGELLLFGRLADLWSNGDNGQSEQRVGSWPWR